MSDKPLSPQIFVSHSSIDAWVAKQIAARIHRCGARTFLYEADIQLGDDFEERILQEAASSSELLVLLTPWAMDRPYIWLEMGVFWGQGKRIVGVVHGRTIPELLAEKKTPMLLQRIELVDINAIDTYFRQLRARVKV